MNADISPLPCGAPFEIDGEAHICSLGAGHLGGHGRIETLDNVWRRSGYESVERVRNSHRSARPNPVENPAWANCHMDCGILLAEIDRLKRYERIVLAIDSRENLGPGWTEHLAECLGFKDEA